MVKSSDKEAVMVAPFLKKCYDMVDDPSTDAIISWSEYGNSFIIWNTTEFSVHLLPKYFKHSNYSSFIRQLNIYGFRKIDTDRWEFANDGFIKGEKSLLRTIARRKHPSNAESGKPVDDHEITVEAKEKPEGETLWAEVENMKTDKNELMKDLVNLKQSQEATEKNLNWARARIQGIEKNQQQMLSLLVMVMQNPNFLVQLLQPKENSWRMAEPGSIVEISNLPKAIESLKEGKDGGFSPELIKALMDDNFPSLDSLGSFILPELSEDRAWEQFLLCSPFENSKEGDGCETDMLCDDYGSLDFFKDFEVPRNIVVDSVEGESEH